VESAPSRLSFFSSISSNQNKMATNTSDTNQGIPLTKSQSRKIPHALSAKFGAGDDENDHDLPSAIEEEDEDRASMSGVSKAVSPQESEKYLGAAVAPMDHFEPTGEDSVALKRRSKESTTTADGEGTNRKTRERPLTAGSPANVAPPNYTGILGHNQSKFNPETFVSIQILSFVFQVSSQFSFTGKSRS
jgi:hypothetical protein